MIHLLRQSQFHKKKNKNKKFQKLKLKDNRILIYHGVLFNHRIFFKIKKDNNNQYSNSNIINIFQQVNKLQKVKQSIKKKTRLVQQRTSNNKKTKTKINYKYSKTLIIKWRTNQIFLYMLLMMMKSIISDKINVQVIMTIIIS